MRRLPDFVSRLAAPLQRLLPRTLLGRVMLLYTGMLVGLLCAGFGAFIKFEIDGALDEAEQGGSALAALVVPAVSDAALIGDYDTIKRTLERCTDHPLFRHASFIDLKGARLDVARRGEITPKPPPALTDWVAARLQEVNLPIVVGGRDYGVMRLTYWEERVASDLWRVMRLALGLAAIGLALGSALVWWPLKLWLGQLDRVQALGEQLQSPGQAFDRLQEDQAPLEFQKTFATFNRVAASLQAERAQASVTLASIAEGVAAINADGTVVLDNPVLGQLLGQPATALRGQGIAQLLPELPILPDTLEGWRGQRFGRGAQVLEASLSPIIDEQGLPAGAVLVLRDVTEQQRLEDQLRAELDSRAQAMHAMSDLLGSVSAPGDAARVDAVGQLLGQVGDMVTRLRRQSDQLHAIFSLSPDGFISFDAERRVQYVSPSCAWLTALDDSQVLDQNEPGLEALLQARLASDDGQRPLVLRELLAGGPRTVHMARPMPRVLSLAMHGGGGTETSQMLHIRDISQQFQLDRLQSEFLTTAAHELRTPMTSIFGFTELLLAREMPAAKQQDVLRRVHRQCQAMMEILNELLDLARIEARRGQDFKFAPAELAGVVREAVEDFQPPAGRSAPRLLAEVDTAWTHIDAGKFKQALRNVLSNAYKYSPGGGAVTVRISRAADELCVQIADEGIGLSADDLSRVTERFFRADKSGNIPGTGLGMAIVKEIIELMGGRLHLRSELGVGTTVELLLHPHATPAAQAA